MPSLSSPLSHPSRIAEAGETSKPKKKAATFNSIPSLSILCPCGGAGAESLRRTGATCCGALFQRFCATAGLNRPGCAVRITKPE
uniref:Uncharacterized protein n=1 Tax=Saccharum spontaneum TaxID=62335 RepID=A0A678THU9_SACSP|nr:hypothetical protein SS04J15_000001 [Saccharum spontaneum]